MTNRHSRSLAAVAVVALLLAGAWLRVAGNGDRFLWFDEVNTALLFSGHDLDREVRELSGRELEPGELRALMRLDDGSDARSTIEVIIKHDPQLSPLYFLVLGTWARIVGDSVGELRRFSAVADLLVLPFMFWVCMELSGSTRAGWIAIVLAAISPFHVVYSQELRQYTFWMLLIVSSSAVLLWTLRTRRIWKWSLYGLMVAAGLYTHVLFAFVVASHTVYVFATRLLDRSDPRAQAGRDLTRYLVATACGIALFAPWIWVMWTHLPAAAAQVSWSEEDVGVLHLMGMWGYNYSALFLDTNHVMRFMDQTGRALIAPFLPRALILIPAVLAVIDLARRPSQKPGLFLLPLILVPFLGLALPDLALGGIRSGGGNRYMAASFLGLEIAMAHWLARGAVSSEAGTRAVARGTLFTVVAMGLVSGWMFCRADTWWHKSLGHFNMDVARIINSEARPLLISDDAPQLLSVSHSLDDRAKMLLVHGDGPIRIPDRHSGVYVLSPSVELKRDLEAVQGARLDAVFPRGELYKFTATKSSD